MKICVINGSPKGNYSITLQTVLYIGKLYPDCEFEILNVGQKIKAYEKNMTEAAEKLSAADMVLFSYPVYTFIAPSQLHRFIELLKENEVRLDGKYAAQITTSKHFFDVTAHKYIEQNCTDLGMKYLCGLSADMDDLLSEKGRTDAKKFWEYVVFCAENNIFKPAVTKPPVEHDEYVPTFEECGKSDSFDIVIVTDCSQNDTSLKNMITDFRNVLPYESRVINISEFPFSGGCLGCFNCASDGKCVYKDGFDTFLREKIQTDDAIVYAFTVRDHSMGAAFKRYDDRQFCNGHRTVTAGMPFGYIACGNYCDEPNLQMIIEGRAEVGGNFLSGVAVDSDGIKRMAQSLAFALENKTELPRNFYGVGGMKIFRDLIYLMRGMMKADHRFYKKYGIYDFPQKQQGTILKMKLVGGLISNPKIKAKMGSKMNEGMIAPYKKVIEAAVKK